MRVKEYRRSKERPAIHYTEKDLMNELKFYLADKILQDLFLLDQISLEEYQNIRTENIKTIAPILKDIML